MSPRELDEDDVRVRPRPGSRPRTRTRPAHADAATGFVLTVDRALQSLDIQSNITWPRPSSSQTRKAIEFQTRHVWRPELNKPT